MLFDLQRDPTECDNIAADHPDLLRELIATFDEDAFANHANPLDNRILVRALTHSPERLAKVNRPQVFNTSTEGYQAIKVSPLWADRDYKRTLPFDWLPGFEGVLFALGDKLIVHSNGGYLNKDKIRLALRPGAQQLTIWHRVTGRLRGAVGLAARYRDLCGWTRRHVAHNAVAERRGAGYRSGLPHESQCRI